jgi:hypothetical protein
MSDSIKALENAIEVIKVQETRCGRSVSVSDVAIKADISDEQLAAFLRGEARMPDGFVAGLYDAYGMEMKRAEVRTRACLPPKGSK